MLSVGVKLHCVYLVVCIVRREGIPWNSAVELEFGNHQGSLLVSRNALSFHHPIMLCAYGKFQAFKKVFIFIYSTAMGLSCGIANS